MTKDEALRLALEALCCVRDMVGHPDNLEYIDHQVAKIEAALEAKDEPVSQPKVRTGNCLRVGVCASEGHKIQPQRTWVGLTNDEVNDFAAGCHLGNSVQGAIYKAEAKLKEKNT
jgi:hypothetical protein